MASRRSRGPLAAAARSSASSVIRMARSPMACTWIWKPSRSSAAVRASSVGLVAHRLAGVAVPVEIGRKHRGSARLDDAVLEQLHRDRAGRVASRTGRASRGAARASCRRSPEAVSAAITRSREPARAVGVGEGAELVLVGVGGEDRRDAERVGQPLRALETRGELRGGAAGAPRIEQIAPPTRAACRSARGCADRARCARSAGRASRA